MRNDRPLSRAHDRIVNYTMPLSQTVETMGEDREYARNTPFLFGDGSLFWQKRIVD